MARDRLFAIALRAGAVPGLADVRQLRANARVVVGANRSGIGQARQGSGARVDANGGGGVAGVAGVAITHDESSAQRAELAEPHYVVC